VNNEQLKDIGQKLLKRIDLVVLAVLLGLMITAGAMVLSESGSTPPEPEDPPVKTWTFLIPHPGLDPPAKIENKDFDEVTVSLIEANPDINQDPAARRLIANNMFVLKSAAEQEATRQESNRKYNEAERLAAAGDNAGALRIVEEILVNDPSYSNARQLREKLQAPPATPAPAAP
jgi:hypothetical protein